MGKGKGSGARKCHRVFWPEKEGEQCTSLAGYLIAGQTGGVARNLIEVDVSETQRGGQRQGATRRREDFRLAPGSLEKGKEMQSDA